jgi:hypothetical protein
MDGNEVTEGDSGVEPKTGAVSDEVRVESPENATAKDRAEESVTADPPGKVADTSKKSGGKAEGKPKPPVKEEPSPAQVQKTAEVSASESAPGKKDAEPEPPAPVASGPQPAKLKSLAEVMKVDLRVRRRRSY